MMIKLKLYVRIKITNCIHRLYTDKELKNKYDFFEKVTKSFTLYASWVKKDDLAAFIENDRTYTPIRFISEELGAGVEWPE